MSRIVPLRRVLALLPPADVDALDAIASSEGEISRCHIIRRAVAAYLQSHPQIAQERATETS